MDNIRMIRALQRKSQWEISKQTGIAQSRLSLIENSLVTPKFKELEAIARELDVTVNKLIEKNPFRTLAE